MNTIPFLRVVLTISSIVFFSTGCSLGTPPPSDLIGKPAPHTRYTMLDGSWHSSYDLQGKNVVMVFWASWCAFSRPVVEEINSIAEAYSGRDDIQFLAVSVDEASSLQKIEERIAAGRLYALSQAFSGNGLYDETYLAYRASALPDIFVIDKSGTVVAQGHSASIVRDFLRNLA